MISAAASCGVVAPSLRRIAPEGIMASAVMGTARSPGHGERRFHGSALELLVFRAARHCASRKLSAGDRGLHRVEVAGAYEGLVLGGTVARALLRKLALLQL